MRMQHMKEFDSDWTVIEFKTEHEMNWDKCLAYSNYICDYMDNPDCTIAKEYCAQVYNFQIKSNEALGFISVVDKMNIIGEGDTIGLFGRSRILGNKFITFILLNKTDTITIQIRTKDLESIKKNETEFLTKEEQRHIFDKFMNEVEIKGEELLAKRAEVKDSVKMYDLMNQIFKNFHNIQQKAYEQEFMILYSMLWELDIIVSDKIKNEIIYIEEKRHSEKYFPSFIEELTPADVVKKYSDIAFWLAQEHFSSNKTFEIASQMNEVFEAFIQEYFLTNDEKQYLEREISETQLDFQYALGNNMFVSVRMSPYIKSKAIWTKRCEMQPIKAYNLINQILEKFPKVQRQAYEQAFQMFYGRLCRPDIISDKIKNEIIYIEEKRLSEKYFSSFEKSLTPVDFVKMCSNLAFLLAKEHCSNQKTFEVASELNKVFLEIVQENYLTNGEKKKFRLEISETQLDFQYASGSDRIASIRMAPHIRAKAIRIKNGID